MATTLNTEFNYRYLVEGETIWAKIKTLQGFLEGRVRAACLERVSELKHQAKVAQLKHLRETDAPEHEVLTVEAELLELDSHTPAVTEAFELNRGEIELIKRLLAEAYTVAEPTRIPGYTDQQMFEANAANEFTAMMAKEIQAEVIANGRPSPAKIRNAMRFPATWQTLQKMGLVPNDVLVFGDDQAISLIGSNGTDVAKTPSLP